MSCLSSRAQSAWLWCADVLGLTAQACVFSCCWVEVDLGLETHAGLLKALTGTDTHGVSL